MTEAHNVIHAVFENEFKISVYGYLKAAGITATRGWLLGIGYQPVFVNALLRNIMRNRGW